MWRPFATIAGLTAALSLGAAPALAFQEIPVPPLSPPGQSAPQAKPPALQLGTPTAPSNVPANSGGVHVFGYDILPKLDFGLELLYGQEQQQMELQAPTMMLEDDSDVSVLGKVKRRF